MLGGVREVPECQWRENTSSGEIPHLLPATARRHDHVEKIEIHSLPIDAG